MSDTPRTIITVKQHGTYLVTGGDFLLQDVDGNPLVLPERKDPTRISMCGCGQSLKWPVCDASHKICGRGTPGNPIPREDVPPG